MHSVNVDLGERSYPIHIGEGLLGRAELMRTYIGGGQVAIVTNDVVAPLYLDVLLESLAGLQVDVYTLPDGEQYTALTGYQQKGVFVTLLMPARMR